MLDFSNTATPSVPRSKTNPVGQTKRIDKARKAAFADIRKAQKLAIEAVESWPYQIKNDIHANAFYEFLIDVEQLRQLVDAIRSAVANGGGAEAIRAAAEAAYREGVSRAVENLARISDDYPRTVLQRLGDQLVIRRATLAGSRAFEQMEGFAGQTGQDLARILFQAVQDGENPRATARTIRRRFSVAKSRAERIARTEITMAHRRGRWDEAQDAEDRFGVKTRLLHNSALIAGRTRRSHAARHGKLFTREEEAAWYASDGNAINCLCSQTEVVLGEDGEPISGKKLLERMKKRRKQFLAAAVEPGSV